MKIKTVQTENNTYSIGDKIKVKFFPIKDDEEDKNNPIEKNVTIQNIIPTDDGSDIKLMCVDEKGNDDFFFEDNILEKLENNNINNLPTEEQVLQTIFNCVDIRGIELEDYKYNFTNERSGLYNSLVKLFSR
jgi:hypothetical protein